MNEHVFAAIITNDKAEALLSVEEFDDTGAFANDLGRHATATAACATTKTTTAAASETTAAATAEAVTAASKAIATAAEPIAAATEAVTTAAETAAFEPTITETVALVPAASATITAAPFIKTHALFVFPSSPKTPCKNPSLGRQTQVFRRSTACATAHGILENQGCCEQNRRQPGAWRSRRLQARWGCVRYATMTPLLALLADPAAWAALITLIVLEVVLGIDNLIFISILSN